MDQLEPLLAGLDDQGLRDLEDINRQYALEERNQTRDLAYEVERHFMAAGIGDRLLLMRRVNDYMATPAAQRRIRRETMNALHHEINDIAVDFANLSYLDPQDPLYQDQFDDIYDAIGHVAQMSPDDWLGDDDPNGRPMLNGVMDGLHYHMHPTHAPGVTPPPAPPNNPNNPPTPEAERLQQNVERLRREVEHMREHKRDSSVDRQRASWGDRDAVHRHHNRTLNSYANLVTEYLDALREQLASEGADEAAILAEIQRVTNTLETNETIEEKQLLVEKGGFMARMMERYSRLGRVQKVVVGLGLGALIGVGVAGMTAGVGLGVGAAAVLGITRMARSYALALSSLYAPTNARPEPFQVDPNATPEEAITAAEDYIRTLSTERIATADRMRRRAVWVGVGGLALGMAAEHVLPLMDTATDHVRSWLGENIFGGHSGVAHATEGSVARGSDIVVGPSIGDQIGEAAGGNAKLSHLIDQHTDGTGNLNIPLKRGDGFELIGDRYGFTDAQQNKLEEIMATHQNSGHGQTYMKGGDMRINFADGYLHLSPQETLTILNAK